MNDIISIKKLNKIFPGNVHAVDNLDMCVREGEIYAFLGPNGAGKSTTLRIICGLCRPSSGSVFLDGVDLLKRRSEYMQKIGLVSQHFNIDLDLTGYENLKVHAYLYRMRGREMKDKIKRLLHFVDLHEKKDIAAAKYSGGMKRKLQIVRAILHDPEILFLDEPTAGLDPLSREKIWNLIKSLNTSGRTIFFTTHYIEEAENYAERVSIIHKGRIIKTGSPRNLIEELGEWCRETFWNNQTCRRHFKTREKAEEFSGDEYRKLTIRRTQLEDVFISLTGEEIDANSYTGVNG